MNINFINYSYGATVIDSVRWSFSNGTPSTSKSTGTQAVSFSTPGWQTVTITAYNSQGSSTKTKQIYISQAGANTSVGSLVEGFEDMNEFNNNWIVNNFSNNVTHWYVNTYAAYSGTHSIVMNAFYTPNLYTPFDDNEGDIDELISPSVDLTGVSPLYLGFRYSCATKAFKAVDISESLKLSYSADCGKSWTPINPAITGVALANAATDPGSYTPPPGFSMWKTAEIALGSGVAKNNVRFKFQYNSGPNSNNLFIDDINISSTPLGIDQNQEVINSLSVFPNPASQSATISYHVGSRQNVELAIYDMLGNKVMPIVSQTQEQGDYNFTVNKQNLSNGLYFIRLSVGDKSSTVKKFVLVD